MKREDFNIYEFHQNLIQKMSQSNEEEEWKNEKDEILQKLETDLSYRDESEYKQHLVDIEQKLERRSTIELFFYYTKDIVEQYKKLLNCTVRDSFTRKKQSTAGSSEKVELVTKYIQTFDIFPELSSYLPTFSSTKEVNRCEDCDSELMESETNTLICNKCGREYPFFYQEGTQISEQISFKDLTRINTNVKYSYIRQTHFKDTIKQFQGKQNKYIDPKVYELLISSFDSAQLNAKDKRDKYTQITKDHIKMFLQEHSLYKYYEDINLIFNELTGTPCPNISDYEKTLIEDFDKLVIVYDKVIKKDNKYNRSNFLNSYYILFQLLKRHSYTCKESDFPLIKTIDRKIEHDEIYEECCKQLGWFFYATV
jgi:hypothetical protein